MDQPTELPLTETTYFILLSLSPKPAVSDQGLGWRSTCREPRMSRTR